MSPGFGEVNRKVKRMKRIVWSILLLFLLGFVFSCYNIATAIEDNGGLRNVAVKILKEAKTINSEASIQSGHQ